MGTVLTPVHSLIVPDTNAAVNVPSDMLTLADGVDGLLPVVSTSTPTPAKGLIWYNTTTQQLQVSDGVTWLPLTAGYLYAATGSTGGVATLTTGGTLYPITSAAVTVTLATQRNLRVVARGTRITMASGTNSLIRISACSNTGSGVSSPLPISAGMQVLVTVTGTSGVLSITEDTTAVYPAGTYTFSTCATRVIGGSATDTAAGDIAVYDAGPA